MRLRAFGNGATRTGIAQAWRQPVHITFVGRIPLVRWLTRIRPARVMASCASGRTRATLRRRGSDMSEGRERGDGKDLVLPAFEMDCRDWLVVGPTEAGLPEDVAGVPLLAVLSTVLIDNDIEEATRALTVGVLDDDGDLDSRPPRRSSADYDSWEDQCRPGCRRYAMPAPGGHRLALLAE